MNILDLAFTLSGEKLVSPPAGDIFDTEPVDSVCGCMLAEMELAKKFDRSQPSMEYKGSTKNATYVRDCIRKRYGDDEASVYEPCVQAKPLTEWLKLNYYPKEDEPLCRIPTVRGGTMLDCDIWHINQMEKEA